MNIRRVGVVGCGLMGSGIAQVCATSGYATSVLEVNEAVLNEGLARIQKSLDAAVAKGRLKAEDRDKATACITGTTVFAGLRECEVVIEAVVENIDVKDAVYRALEDVLDKRALILSNTSSLCVTELAARTRRPDRFAGLHFFNPPPVMKLVEIIRSLTTSDETHRDVAAFAASLGKEAIVALDRPGFIVNRLLIPYLLSAIRAYENGLGTLQDIDTGMKLGCGYPMGPFSLLDYVGLDTTYYVANIMFDEFKDPAYAPPPLLKRMVLAGRLGRKSGSGFYTYDS